MKNKCEIKKDENSWKIVCLGFEIADCDTEKKAQLIQRALDFWFESKDFEDFYFNVIKKFEKIN